MTWPQEIAAFVAAIPTHGGTVGTDVFAFKIPALPERVVAIVPYFPAGSQRVLCPNPSFERFRFQLLVRDAYDKDELAYARAYAIHRKLDVVLDATLSGAHYVSIEGIQPPFDPRRDSNERLIVTANYEAWRDPT